MPSSTGFRTMFDNLPANTFIRIWIVIKWQILWAKYFGDAIWIDNLLEFRAVYRWQYAVASFIDCSWKRQPDKSKKTKTNAHAIKLLQRNRLDFGVYWHSIMHNWFHFRFDCSVRHVKRNKNEYLFDVCQHAISSCLVFFFFSGKIPYESS